MADYDLDQIVREWEEEGKPPYSTWHKRRGEAAKGRGDKFPAYETFRRALENKGLIKEKSRRSSTSDADGRTESIDPEYLEFLKENLRDEVKENPEFSFMKWKIERLEEENRELRAKEKEQPR